MLCDSAVDTELNRLRLARKVRDSQWTSTAFYSNVGDISKFTHFVMHLSYKETSLISFLAIKYRQYVRTATIPKRVKKGAENDYIDLSLIAT